MTDPKAIKCPECLGSGIDTMTIVGMIEKSACQLCGGLCTIPDRRAASANDRAVERIKEALLWPMEPSLSPGLSMRLVAEHQRKIMLEIKDIINEEAGE